jgi:acyl-CoA dehydrogenase
MDISQSARSAELAMRIQAFMAEHIYPSERRFYQEAERLGPWAVHPVVEELKSIAKNTGLWNLFLPAQHSDGGLTNLEYAPLCEIMGRSLSRPRCSTAAPLIPATWRRSCATGPRRRRSSG